MPKIKTNMKRFVAAIERANAAHRLFYGHPRVIRSRLSKDTLKHALEQAGVDFDEIKKANKALILKRRRDWEKERPRRDAKSDAQALKTLRHVIAEQRKRAKRPSVTPLLKTTTVNIDTPFEIKAKPAGSLKGSNFEAWNSTASYGVQYVSEIPDDGTEDSLYFFFQWTNDTGEDALVVNAETPLVVKGSGDCLADPGLFNVVCWSALTWWAEFSIWETWNEPATLLSPQATQEILVADLYAEATGPGVLVPDTDRKLVDVFRAYSLAHSNFFVVPRNATVVFQVGLEVISGLDGGGWTSSSFLGDWGFLMCPYVALQVAPWDQGPIRKEFRMRN